MTIHMDDGDEKKDDLGPGAEQPGSRAGEDAGSTAVDGEDDHLKDDQEPTTK